MSDTPETDALREAIDNGAATEAEMTSLAGKLERERDKAQALVAEMKQAIVWAKAEAKERLHRLDQAACERRTWLEAHEKMKRERDNLQDQRDFAMGEIERLRRERDEAVEREIVAIESWDEERKRAIREGERVLEAREKYFAMRDLSNNATELAKKYKQERDTAKANLREAVALISDRVKCDDFHHEKCDRHTIGEACPIVARFKAAVKRLEEVAYE